MILNILDTDLYKFTTSYAYMKLYPNAIGTFEYVDRDHNVYDEEFINTLKRELRNLAGATMSNTEFDLIRKNVWLSRFLPMVYWEWLRGFRFDPNLINVYLDEYGHLHINVTDCLYKVTLYEVPILYIVSECYYKHYNIQANIDLMFAKLKEKIDLSNAEKLVFSEFGTRRRYSFNVHELVVKYLKDNAKYCVGTSNVYFALKYNMMPCGTFPHEWVMFHGAIWGYQQANELAMRDWVRCYDGDLGTVLCDTYTTKFFIKQFSRKYSKLFDGPRLDSGDEKTLGDLFIQHYESLGINPLSKTLIMSNALDFPRFKEIRDYFAGRINVAAGIGTNLTNDCGVKPLNEVMKLIKVWQYAGAPGMDCIKRSDDQGKRLGSAVQQAILDRVLEDAA
jgi:nicotinate phosphoribosyltransferase